MDAISSIIEQSRDMFTRAKGSHRWDHTERVCKMAQHIASIESADQEIVTIAAYLHDIGRTREDESSGKICHAKVGAQMAEKMLREMNIDRQKTEQIVHCIAAHRFRDEVVPQSLEAKVLFDADKLDSIGAVGIGRAFLFAGEIGAHLHQKDKDPSAVQPYSEEDTAYNEFLVKLQYVQDRMLTVEGKRLASERHQFMVDFFHRLNNEVEGFK